MLSIDDYTSCEVCEERGYISGKRLEYGYEYEDCENCRGEGGFDNRGIPINKQDFLGAILEDGK